jgi:hydrogenase maturation protein HypF
VGAAPPAGAPAGPPGSGFRILESGPSPYSFPPVPPDLALCPDCRRELLDPSDRRFLYPFITCTQCGPRYSILARTPFDRGNTSMFRFTQCADCAREYTDPLDRRFHSQTNSCRACGPRLACVDGGGAELPGYPLETAVRALASGKIVAVQGVGGFHLAVDPSAADAMARLRAAKERQRKPFALMVRDIEEARSLCALSGAEEELLTSVESPIVIAARRSRSPDSVAVVSDTDTLGLLLPYTPLHLLLFFLPTVTIPYRSLVMTSGNRANEPIATDPDEARASLAGIADCFLVNDRRIIFRADDSIVRVGDGSPPFLLRRSRGFVPGLIHTAVALDGVVLGLGGDLKSAPALGRGHDIHLSPYLGDLDDPATLSQFDSQVLAMQELYGVAPNWLIHDLHPLYRSTRWAERFEASWGGQAGPAPVRLAVQHHFAHLLSVMAEHGLEEAIGLAFDGTGYGTDGTTWGGEFLHATRSSFSRLGHFEPFGLPGGDAAVLHPARIALAIVGPRADTDPFPGLDPRQRALIDAMLEKGVNCPRCSSLGRVFDAAAAILGLVDRVTYEGEGPIRLEGAALRARAEGASAPGEGMALSLLPFSEGFTIDSRPLLVELLAQREKRPTGELALLFHQAVAFASLEGARRLRRATGVANLALSGGVFQNLLLRELLLPLLNKEGFHVFLNQKAPPGDGGISVGQVWFAPK